MERDARQVKAQVKKRVCQGKPLQAAAALGGALDDPDVRPLMPAAGWVPISVWIKISSLTNLRDQVRAINASGMRASVEVGAWQGQVAAVPGVRINLAF